MDYNVYPNSDGSITISVIHKGIRRRKLYIGHTIKEAEVLFYEWLATIKALKENDYENQYLQPQSVRKTSGPCDTKRPLWKVLLPRMPSQMP